LKPSNTRQAVNPPDAVQFHTKKHALIAAVKLAKPIDIAIYPTTENECEDRNSGILPLATIMPKTGTVNRKNVS
jgi:hypothetical protein